MAFIDEKQKNIVLRIVYAGALMLGKTASIKGLDQELRNTTNSNVTSPWETEGRTLYFDWLDYTAGLFQGRKVRSQIISVPGQESLIERRQLILKNADAIVFVVDSRREEFKETQHFFLEMIEWLDQSAEKNPIPTIVQANKSDLDDLFTPDQLKEKLGDRANMAVISTNAISRQGLRQVFVMAVGLALERLKISLEQDIVLTETTLFDNEESLLTYIETTESKTSINQSTSTKEQLSPDPSPHFIDLIKANNLCPPLPTIEIANEYIWPPIEGRVLLNDINNSVSDSQCSNNGSWSIQIPSRWKLYNDIQACYKNSTDAIIGLKRYQQSHQTWKKYLSEHRAYTIVQDHLGFYRIWQIIRRERDMRFAFERIFHGDKLDYMLLDLLTFIQQLRLIHTEYKKLQLPLADTLDDLGLKRKNIFYFGFLPVMQTDTNKISEKIFIRQCLSKQKTYVKTHTLDVQALIRRLRQHVIDHPEQRQSADLIAEILI